MRNASVQLSQKGQRLAAQLARESRKPVAEVIDAALKTYQRQFKHPPTGAPGRPRVAKKLPAHNAGGWEKWIGYCRKSFQEMGDPSVDEYIEMVRGR
jgi:hypothetical protein